MEPRFLPVVYAAEFLLALIAVFTTWSQVGGQGHLDLMAWYLKLSLGLAMAYAIVRATWAAAGDQHGWNGRTLRWIGILALLATAAGTVTYYYHVYEPADEEDNQSTTQSSIRTGEAAALLPAHSKGWGLARGFQTPLTRCNAAQDVAILRTGRIHSCVDAWSSTSRRQ
jgi:hypothetical protein